jgi:hypothetical protein
MITRVASALDIDGILKLQALNLMTNLPTADYANGFVTTPFSVEHIKELLAQTGAFVAEKDGSIVGYLFAGSWEFYAKWPIFPFMVSRFPLLSFQGLQLSTRNTFQYGPICIDHSLRGSGVFLQLFETMRSSFAPRLPIGYTFINKANQRSLAAHTRKLNLDIIDDFEFNGQSFNGLAFWTTPRT